MDAKQKAELAAAQKERAESLKEIETEHATQARDLIQGDHRNGTPESLLARILALEATLVAKLTKAAKK